MQQAGTAEIQLSDDQIASARLAVEREIADGRLKESEKEMRLRDVEEGLISATRAGLFLDAAEQSRKVLKVPGEQDVIEVLLDPNTTPEQIRALCKDALMNRTVEVQRDVFKEIEVPAWPIPAGSMFPTYLAQYAEQHVSALNDPRFPRCEVAERPSTRLKQFWFLSRALAGALYGVKTRTAINLVGSLRPEEMFREARDGKPARRPRKVRSK